MLIVKKYKAQITMLSLNKHQYNKNFSKILYQVIQIWTMIFLKTQMNK
jgi:hypothetical protein